MTIEYPLPEMILAGEVSPRRCNRAVERTKAEIYAAQKKRGRNGYGAWQRTKKGGKKHTSFLQKGKPLNCCSSPAARRVSENADSICKQSNRGTSETQVIFL